MKALRATLAALLMMAMLAFPAFAQDGKAGAGDDQQVPDNQQTGGGKATVTKTFELTINGDVPADAAFVVGFVEEGQDPDIDGRFVVLCGDISQLPEEELEGIPDEDIISDEVCAGDGAVHSFEREFAQGTNLAFFFARASVTDEDVFEIFFTSLQNPDLSAPPGPGDFETLDTDMTNTAWYTFGTGAGDDQQDTGAGKDTGAGDDQQVPDNQQTGGGKDTGAGDDQQDDTQDDGTGAGDDQQDDTQDDVQDTGTGAGDDQQDDTQDDQQGEMPEELPETGAGGLAGGLPLGSAAAGASLLAASGYAVLRRR